MSTDRSLFVSLDDARELCLKQKPRIPRYVTQEISDSRRRIEIDGGSIQDRVIARMAEIIEAQA